MATDGTPGPLAGDLSDQSPWYPVPYRVDRRTAETADTVTLTLSPAKGTPLHPFRPGQFNMLYVFGVGEAAISVSGDPALPEALVHTVRTAGKISGALTGAAPGSTVGVRGPYGSGWPLEEAVGRDVVLVAGGLGLPPLRPVLYELLRHRERYGRIEVIYGARTPKDLVYYRQIQEWRGRSDLRFQTTVDAAGRDWYGDVGLVTARVPDIRVEPARTVAFLCGPEVMMKFTAQALEARGVTDSAIYVSLERNMKCAVGLCGHCQLGPEFVCRDGPVFRYHDVRRFLSVREL
ncbi:MAG: FAD/NAD(P)-binding protein [Thermoplasmata archaeon]|jgi:NAD(P)H-flavin reductase|nr:FAD/NAD(P)-binding protein [Thermoplasmata archaeon]